MKSKNLSNVVIYDSNNSNALNISNGMSSFSSNDSNASNISNDLNVTNGSRHWYVIYTKPHSEDTAREQLEQKEIPVFLPRIREVKFRRRRLEELVRPLFPSYLFARFTIPDEYYNVKWAKGVKRIVGSGDMPLPLDDSIVVFLRGQVNEEGLVQPRSNLRHGDKVRVKQGPLEGLWGIVQGEIDARQRIKILMDILHSGAKVELPYAYIEKYD